MALRYFLDTEFNGFGGALISLALVSEAGPSLYLIYGEPSAPDQFYATTSNRTSSASPPMWRSVG